MMQKLTVFILTFILSVFLGAIASASCTQEEKTKLWNEYNRLLNVSDYESTIPLLEKIRICAESLDDDFSLGMYYIYMADGYFREEDFNKTLFYLEELTTIDDSLKMPQADYYYMASAMQFVYGRYYRQVGAYEQSLNHYQNSINILLEAIGYEEGKEMNVKRLGYDFRYTVQELFNNTAVLYNYFGDYNNAVKYFDIAIEYSELVENNQRLDYSDAWIIHNLSRTYIELGEKEKTFELYNKAQEMLMASNDMLIEEYRPIISGYAYKNMMLHYNKTEQLDSSYYFASKAMDLKMDHKIWVEIYQNHALTLIKDGKYEDGNVALDSAMEMTHKYFSDLHPEMSKNYYLKGELELGTGRLDEAMAFYNRALNMNRRKKGDECDCEKILISELSDKKLSLDILKGKADALAAQSDFESAISCFRLMHKIIKELRTKYLVNDESRFFLASESRKIAEKAIRVCLENKDFENAYLFSQESRSMILLQHLQDKVAKKVSDISDDVLDLEKDLKLKINALRKKKEYAALKGLDVSEYEAEISMAEVSYQKLMTKIENEFPNYYELKFNLPQISIPELQKALKKSESVLLEYFLGEEDLFVFLLDGNDLHVESIPVGRQLFKYIKTVVECIGRPNSDVQTFDDFVEASYGLHESLLGKLSLLGKIKRKNLIIIPDEEIQLVPFDVLIQEQFPKGNNEAKYHKLDYLVNDFNISYQYSSHLIQNKQIQKNNSKEFLGVAPVFADPEIRPLKNNRKEVENINVEYLGENLLGVEASYANFQKSIAGKSIVHFATHAIFNDEIPLDSRIELADTSLYIYEIFSLEHDLQLAVMSACQTASGNQRKGEGVVSLARAFFQSGCPSVVASLWDVSDYKAADIMADFHSNLLEGKRKDEALAQAKRNYLENAISKNTHPFFWAGFIAVGQTDAILEQGKGWGTYALMAAGILLFILMGYFFFKKSK